jgi:ParB family transcriptional regulator, chromosome partitioning protein
MTKKKRFGISEALTRGLSETINVVENNLGVFRNVILPLSRIELDPENPRKMAIDLADVRSGIRPEDPLYQQKNDELERLKELAHTIKANGIINPIVVYKRGESYRIVAGERRCLASILASKQEIEARIFNEKPKAFELKLMQWVENTAREDLTLMERLDNVRDLLNEYQKQHTDIEITATILKNITGLSLSQSTYYLLVLNAPEDVRLQIHNGSITNLDKAAIVTSVTSVELRKHVLDACLAGHSLKELRAMISQQKMLQRSKSYLKKGGVTTKINMGSTSKIEVIKTIVDAVITHKQLSQHAASFTKIAWNDLRQSTKAFRKLIKILEIEISA